MSPSTSGVLILPQRQTGVVAKQAAEVDILSSGRLRLGIGVGWNHVEYEALGTEWKTRGARQAEQVEVMRRLWTEDLVTFAGKFHTLVDVNLLPPPIQRPIPIWFGGSSDAVVKRAARLRAELAQAEVEGRYGPVVSCVDKGKSRQDIQGLHPRLVLGGSALGLSAKTNVYDGVPGTPCLGCHTPAERDGDCLRELEKRLRALAPAEQ